MEKVAKYLTVENSFYIVVGIVLFFLILLIIKWLIRDWRQKKMVKVFTKTKLNNKPYKFDENFFSKEFYSSEQIYKLLAKVTEKSEMPKVNFYNFPIKGVFYKISLKNYSNMNFIEAKFVSSNRNKKEKVFYFYEDKILFKGSRQTLFVEVKVSLKFINNFIDILRKYTGITELL